MINIFIKFLNNLKIEYKKDGLIIKKYSMIVNPIKYEYTFSFNIDNVEKDGLTFMIDNFVLEKYQKHKEENKTDGILITPVEIIESLEDRIFYKFSIIILKFERRYF